MKTNKTFRSFLATSSRKFFKYGLGLAVLFAIVAFKIPLYSHLPEIPFYEEEEFFEIEYVTQVLPPEVIKEKPVVKEQSKTPPVVLTTLTTTQAVLPKKEVKKIDPISSSTKKQVLIDPVPPASPKVWDVVEKMPEFRGGEAALYQHFAKEIHYNTKAVEWGIEGKVYIRFVVNKTGEIVHAEIARGVHPLLDEEALRVVQNMPNWLPGIQNGQEVDVSMVVPVNFVLK